MPEIVVIEDDERMLELLHEQLGRNGYSLTEARDGESALKAIREKVPDAVLLEIRLPDMSGVRILEQLRREHGSLPIIVLTGLVDVDLAVEVMKKGAFDFLTKPLKVGALLACVEKAVGYRALLEENQRLSRENEAYHENLERMIEQRTRELLDTQKLLVQLTSRVARLDQLSAAGRMAATMAHEVSNPMAAIQGYTELALLRDDLDPELIEALTIIHRQCTRVGQILRQYRNLTRMPAPCLSETSLAPVIDEILRLCSSYCLSRKIRVSSELNKDVRAAVDAPQMQQVLFNLIFNACQAMPGGGEIDVNLAPCEGREGEVCFSVRDNGAGIQDEHLPRIFDDFFSTHDEGCGLGLSIVRDIVERHQGRIEVESQPERGTTFRVILPARPPVTVEGTVTAARHEA